MLLVNEWQQLHVPLSAVKRLTSAKSQTERSGIRCSVGLSQYGLEWGGGVNPIDFQSHTQHLTASNIRFVFLSEEVICYFETVEICLVLHILLSLIKDVHFQS